LQENVTNKAIARVLLNQTAAAKKGGWAGLVCKGVAWPGRAAGQGSGAGVCCWDRRPAPADHEAGLIMGRAYARVGSQREPRKQRRVGGWAGCGFLDQTACRKRGFLD